MSAGIFFFVVGPSGAGKDSLIEGARRLEPRFCFARRAITRPAGSPGEDHDALDETTFDALEARGEFLVTWAAHGLRYGLRRDLLDAVAEGRHVIANGSRRMIGDLAGRVPRLVVIEVSAPAEVLEARLLGRGRETPEQVRARVAREVEPCSADVEIRRIVNDGSLEEGVGRFMNALRHAIEPPPSTPLLYAKLAGAALDEAQYEALSDDILAQRYAERDVDRFLLHACQHVSDAEVLALARVRTKRMPRIEWNEPIVVDKHSMGGIPGSRITLIVVPIVAAYGLAMPKTSSRAITSAAGTADAMETVARVDLTPQEMRRCVETARACIAWNGRLNHSLIDERINAFTRPLGLDTNRWSVASILSKKVSAGSTHVIVDLPCGPHAKLKHADDAHALAALFEYVGAGVGLQVKALVTDGSGPVGRGIGPALEVRDVGLVLDDAPDAPPDLRDKALTFAAHILAWAPGVRDVEEGRRIAQTLLASGAARAAFEQIVDVQGRHAQPVRPAARVHDVTAAHGGTITSIDGWQVAGIARQAGAPADAGAGVDLLCRVGQTVASGDVLYRVHAEHAVALDRAATLASLDTGYLIV